MKIYIFSFFLCCFRGGGKDVVTARQNKWGVRERGSAPLGVPHSQQVILTVNCLALCVRFVVLNKVLLAGLFSIKEVWYWEVQLWYLGSHFAFPWRSAKGRKQHLPCLGDGKTSVSASGYTLSSW